MNDDLVGVPNFVFCLALGVEIEILGSLEGELMLTAIALAAYIRIILLSLKEGNSLSIYKEKNKTTSKIMTKEKINILQTCNLLPEMQIEVVFSSAKPLESNEGARVAESIFAATVMAKQPEHVILMPRS